LSIVGVRYGEEAHTSTVLSQKHRAHEGAREEASGHEAQAESVAMALTKAQRRFRKAAGKHGLRVYDALRKTGLSKGASARIMNAARTKSGRKRMARKAARTRTRRKR
jgi:hypothetical protein